MNDTFTPAMESIAIKSLRTAFLLKKAQKLPYCKRNILEAKILFWSWVYSDLTQRFVLGVKNPSRELNANERCKKYLVENGLANEKFAEFFFAFHAPLTAAFLKILDHELSNGHTIEKKILLIGNEIVELLNIARIELEGMRMSCTAFGCTPMCPYFKETGHSECEKYGIDNVFSLFINPEYYLEKGLFDNILNSLNMIKTKDDIIMVVDYRNMCDRQKEYSWDSNGAWERYQKCKEHVKEVYFYHYAPCVSFGSHYDDLKPFLIPTKIARKEVCEKWSKERKLIYF